MRDIGRGASTVPSEIERVAVGHCVVADDIAREVRDQVEGAVFNVRVIVEGSSPREVTVAVTIRANLAGPPV